MTYFMSNKYCVFKEFFSQKDVNRMVNRIGILGMRNLLTVDPQCPKSLSVYSDPIYSEMQEIYTKKLEYLTGLSLFPTYNYSRIYFPKEILKYHSDRPSCEISLTGTLSFDTFDDKPWRIYIEKSKSTKSFDNTKSVLSNATMSNDEIRPMQGIEVELYPGDILVYRGCELPHWREKFVGVRQIQTFMHFVDQNGPFKDYKYDCRNSLGDSGEGVNRLRLDELNAKFVGPNGEVLYEV